MRVLKNENVTVRMSDRRRRADRRRHHILFGDWRWAWWGKRERSRRDDEAAEYGVDRYQPHLLFLAVGILILSCMDAAFTLVLIERGVAHEGNPFMRILMDHDQQIFVNLKVVLTSAAVVFMVALAEWRFVRVVRVRYIMLATLIAYAALVVYEVVQLAATA